MKRLMPSVGFAVIIANLIIWPSYSASRGVDAVEAHALAVASFAEKGRQYHFEQYVDPSDGGQFFRFEVGWANPRGSLIVGHLAVDRITGAVWDVEGSVCRIKSSHRLTELQKELAQGGQIQTERAPNYKKKPPIECQLK
jgi:hypothetical protein